MVVECVSLDNPTVDTNISRKYSAFLVKLSCRVCLKKAITVLKMFNQVLIQLISSHTCNKRPCKVNKIPDIQKKPTCSRIHFYSKINNRQRFHILFFFPIFYSKWPWTHTPTSKFVFDVWNVFSCETSLR